MTDDGQLIADPSVYGCIGQKACAEVITKSAIETCNKNGMAFTGKFVCGSREDLGPFGIGAYVKPYCASKKPDTDTYSTNLKNSIYKNWNKCPGLKQDSYDNGIPFIQEKIPRQEQYDNVHTIAMQQT